MYINIHLSEFAQLAVDKLDNFLQLTWFQRPNSGIFRYIQNIAVDHARDQQITLWLCDLRQMVYLEIADQNWLIREFFGVFDPIKKHRLALVVGTEGMELDTVYHIQRLIEKEPYLSNYIEAEIFFDIEMARIWLLDTED